MPRPFPTPDELAAARERVESIMPGLIALALASGGWPDYRDDLEVVLRSYGRPEPAAVTPDLTWNASATALVVAGVELSRIDGDESNATAAIRIVDALEAAGADLLETHGRLVTLPVGGYGRATFGLMDAVLSRLERRHMESSRRVAPGEAPVAD